MSGPRKIPVGPLLASIGAVLLIVSLFLDWYDDFTAWTIFEIVDLVLAGLALWTIYSMLVEMEVVKRTVTGSGITLAATIIALVIVVTQLINDPPAVAGGDAERDIGIWLALAGAAVTVAGALVAATHISLAVEPRRRDEAPPAEPAEKPTTPLAETESPPAGRAGRPTPPAGSGPLGGSSGGAERS